MDPQLRMRQIHLDFHTSGLIDDVGADWDADAFVDTLKRAHVNSITCFARGHHGWVYYLPTKFAPHPALKRNLLGEQIEACHRAGIRVPIYVTVGWDELTAGSHPEWLQVSPAGVLGGRDPLRPGWRTLCLNSPYLDYVWEQTDEVIDLFGREVDGFFFDIILQTECLCHHCQAGMRQRGLDPADQAQRRAYALDVLDAYRRRFAQAVRARVPNATVFHNAGHIHTSFRPTLDTFSHLELESLPSEGQWGYNHFPITARYARTLGKPILGMTGKFHTSWGDFGSFKNQAALEFECFQMIANGAACSIGDQLHPRGQLNGPAYDLIGKVYGSVEAKEPWCVGATALAEIGVFNLEAVGTDDSKVDSAHSGALRMLLEAHQQFDFVDDTTDWSRYSVIVLPDRVTLGPALADKVRAYLAAGGKVIASHRSGLTPLGDRFALDEFGIACEGEAPNTPDYLQPLPGLGADLPATEHVMYDRGLAVRPLPGTQSLAEVTGPYFNRAWDHFCSHRHTPPSPANRPAYAGITRSAAGNVIYFAHPIFSGYRARAVRWYKAMFLGALQQFLPRPLVRCSAPTTAQVTLLRQPEQRRLVAHLLHYIPERRGLEFDTIEDVIPLYNVALAFRADQAPARVYLAPSGADVPFAYADGYVHVTVPEVVGHQMVVAEGV
ncbi:MAG: beta-galactosidase [Chloroflexi bacterium]|nr:beta-galactosidase [Chloroflexota bacterium]